MRMTRLHYWHRMGGRRKRNRIDKSNERKELVLFTSGIGMLASRESYNLVGCPGLLYTKVGNKTTEKEMKSPVEDVAGRKEGPPRRLGGVIMAQERIS